MPNAFHAWDWKVKAAVMSGPESNTLRSDATSLPMLLKLVKVLESYMTSVIDGQQVSNYIYAFWKCKKHLWRDINVASLW